MLAVRVPPSAWSTSQSTVTVRSPSRPRSTTPRRDRPIEALDLVRPAADLAGGRLALRPLGGGARQHGVLGGDPAAALAPQMRRDAVLDRRRAEDLRVADADPAGALGPLLDVERHRHGPQLVRPAPRRAQGRARFPIVMRAHLLRVHSGPPARLRRVPQLVELREGEVAEGDAALGRQALHDPEPAAELLVGRPERGLGLHAVAAGQVDDHHEQVAQLLRAVRPSPRPRPARRAPRAPCRRSRRRWASRSRGSRRVPASPGWLRAPASSG